MANIDHPATAFTRPVATKRARISKVANARDTLKDFDAGMETFVLTYGQFSVWDAVEAILERTGPADITISTWTAASADLQRSSEQLHNDSIRSLRFIVDGSFVTRQAGYAKLLVDLFGSDSVRTTSSHAKFVTIKNEKWNIAILTSMNLNENKRLEYLHISDDENLCGFLNTLADEIFGEEVAGVGVRNKGGMPELAGLHELEIMPANLVSMSRGKVSIGQSKSV